MRTTLFIIISIFSLINFIWEIIWKFLIKNRKYVSKIFYFFTLLSLLYLWSTDNHSIHESWEKALNLLWVILFLPIFAYVFDFSLAKKLLFFRKEMWILMWVLAVVHSTQYFLKPNNIWFWEYEFWFQNWEATYLAWWFLWTIIAIILTITSNNISIKKFWKLWKILHRSVYLLLIFTLLHIIYLKIWWRDWNEVLFETLLPLCLYIIWKILEWKKIKLLTSS